MKGSFKLDDNRQVDCVALYDGAARVAAGAGAQLRLFSTTDKSFVRTITSPFADRPAPSHAGYVTAVAWSATHRRLAAAFHYSDLKKLWIAWLDADGTVVGTLAPAVGEGQKPPRSMIFVGDELLFGSSQVGRKQHDLYRYRLDGSLVSVTRLPGLDFDRTLGLSSGGGSVAVAHTEGVSLFRPDGTVDQLKAPAFYQVALDESASRVAFFNAGQGRVEVQQRGAVGWARACSIQPPDTRYRLDVLAMTPDGQRVLATQGTHLFIYDAAGQLLDDRARFGLKVIRCLSVLDGHVAAGSMGRVDVQPLP